MGSYVVALLNSGFLLSREKYDPSADCCAPAVWVPSTRREWVVSDKRSVTWGAPVRAPDFSRASTAMDVALRLPAVSVAVRERS